MKTINVMREALLAFSGMPLTYTRKAQIEGLLRDAIAAEEAQTPAQVTCQIYGHVVGACGECNTHTEADVNATNAVLATRYFELLKKVEEVQTVEPVGSDEREALIERLTKQWSELDALDPFRADVGLAADMLAADAQEIAGWREDQKENLRNQMELQAQINDLKAQQVAVQQGYALVPIEPTQEMVQACDAKFIPRIALPFFVAAYKTMLAAAPQPPQAEQDNSDDLTAAYLSGLHEGKKQAQQVPMTASEVDLMLRELESEHHCCNSYWPKRLIRAVEAHHGVKP